MNAVRNEWAQGIRAVHDQAAGALLVEIVRPADMAGLIADAMAGYSNAYQILRLTNEFIQAVRASAPKRPMLCGCCPRSIRRRPFNVALAIPACDDAANAVVIGICDHCATDPDALLDKARQGLARIWPDLRAIDVHPTTGCA
ncbi:MAG: hypothetical protein ACRYGM_05305 [Janthinobacterium lividum]